MENKQEGNQGVANSGDNEDKGRKRNNDQRQSGNQQKKKQKFSDLKSGVSSLLILLRLL